MMEKHWVADRIEKRETEQGHYVYVPVEESVEEFDNVSNAWIFIIGLILMIAGASLALANLSLAGSGWVVLGMFLTVVGYLLGGRFAAIVTVVLFAVVILLVAFGGV